MAAVSLVSRNVVIERGPDAARAAALSALKIATVYCDHNGVALVGGTDTITIDLGAAIQASQRNGKTVTVRGAMLVQPITTQVATTGVETTREGFISFAGNILTLVPKTDGYLTGSTNGNVATDAAIVPYGVSVAFTEV